jgi:hypothetical protein
MARRKTWRSRVESGGGGRGWEGLLKGMARGPGPGDDEMRRRWGRRWHQTRWAWVGVKAPPVGKRHVTRHAGIPRHLGAGDKTMTSGEEAWSREVNRTSPSLACLMECFPCVSTTPNIASDAGDPGGTSKGPWPCPLPGRGLSGACAQGHCLHDLWGNSGRGRREIRRAIRRLLPKLWKTGTSNH